jgi:hypothetical protein
MDPIRETKQLPEEDWLGFFATFSTENRNSPVTVELIGPELGDQILVEGAPLMAVDYDPPDKGDNMVITTGEESQEHVMQGPREVWLARDELGRIEVIEIVDSEGVRTLIRLN